MLKTRVLPCLLLKGTGLVKTVRFQDPVYVGDPMNAIRIFNTKEVDELVLLDITATPERKSPSFELISRISDECRMPLTVGGGVRSLDDVKKLLACGAEKVVINTYAIESSDFIKEAAQAVGSQSIIISIDAKKKINDGYEVFSQSGTKAAGLDPVTWAKEVEQKGAGEIFLNSIDNDGTMSGYNLELIVQVTAAVNIPVIVCGGAGRLEDFSRAVHEGGAAAVAAGSMFVFHGRKRAVLINFPTKTELESVLNNDNVTT